MDRQFVAEIALDPSQLLVRHVVGPVEFSRPVAGQLRRLVRRRDILHTVDRHVPGVPVFMVPDQRQPGLDDPFGELERPVADQKPRPGEPLPMLDQRTPMDRKGHGVGQ